MSDLQTAQNCLRLEPGPENPRNSEGDFIKLNDGRLLFIYTHFVEGASDHADAYLAARESSDGGRTWSGEDALVLPNEEAGMNVMSVSLLRRGDGAIALFYCRKESLEDCRPRMRISTDEARTWSEPIDVIPDNEIGYYVLNNDRVIQLERGPHAGRLIVPVALHKAPDWEEWTSKAHAMCYLSDDGGQTWHRSADVLHPPTNDAGDLVALQEPGVVELTDGRVMMFIRTDGGCQYLAFSEDGGEHWTGPAPSELASPTSPASIKRIPGTGDLLLVWNDHRNIDEQRADKRTPLSVAISRDEGQSWQHAKPIFDDPDGWYCYIAIHFEDQRVLLGHVAGRA
ncbi:MAG: sialidase family protein, partial [Phycisphaeraceae bacterium]